MKMAYTLGNPPLPKTAIERDEFKSVPSNSNSYSNLGKLYDDGYQGLKSLEVQDG